MLTELKIANFRGFSDEVTIRIAPITILLGHNNAGKSSVFKLLCLLKQSLALSKQGFLPYQGDLVWLPSLYEQKNVTNNKAFLRFELVSEQTVSRGAPALDSYFHSHPQLAADEGLGRYILNAQVKYSALNSCRGETSFRALTEHSQETVLTRAMSIDDESELLKFPHLPGDNSAETIGAAKMRAESALLDELVKIVATDINGCYHIAADVQRCNGEFTMASAIPFDYVGSQGQHSLNHLWKLHNNHPEAFNFASRHLCEVLDVANIRFDESKFQATCYATNKRTGAETSIGELGFGVSHYLPTLVQGSIMNPGTTLLVEEPEANVHPTAQLAYGSYFAALWQKRNVAAIVETHSANMLLRLRHLIVKKELRPRDVSVAFFTVEAGKTIVKNISIDANGALQKKQLPTEFFSPKYP